MSSSETFALGSAAIFLVFCLGALFIVGRAAMVQSRRTGSVSASIIGKICYAAFLAIIALIVLWCWT